MGKTAVKMKVWNIFDELESIKGWREKEEIRLVELEGLVDTGSTMLVLPEDIVEKLGLLISREVVVTYANGNKERKKVARGVMVEILGRQAEVECLVENRGTKPLVGQVPLEVMDLVVDPKNGTLGPRPESPDMPLIELY